MRDVAIIGAGLCKFGRWFREGKDLKDLGREAVLNAMQDANLTPEEIMSHKTTAYYGGPATGPLGGQIMVQGQTVLNEAGVVGIPVTMVENACSTSSCASREAWIAVGSGLYDMAIAIGADVMTRGTTIDFMKYIAQSCDFSFEGQLAINMPGWCATFTLRHMHEYGTTREQLAMISVKNHHNATMNPYAQYQKEFTVEQVINSRMVAYPFTLLDCCPTSDGASCVIMTTKELAKKYTDTPVWWAGSGHSSGVSYDSWTMRDCTALEGTVRAAKEAYNMAKVEPKDIDCAEVHDAFTGTELMHYEDLDFCKKGEGGKFVEEGQADIGGKTPVNTSGGALSFGHPIGATGGRQIAELTWQLRGDAGKRQVQGAEIGLAQDTGGTLHLDYGCVYVHILRR